MKLLTKLKNCYGIKKLEYDFDFTTGDTFLIYAPNGSMKTSFAKVFNDLSQTEDPKDLVFPQRNTICTIEDETGSAIAPEAIFIVNPYEENFESERIGTLLVNEKLKKEYESIYIAIEKAKNDLVESVKKAAGLKTDVEQQLAYSFKTNTNDIYTILEKVEQDVNATNAADLSDIIYQEIFNEKVLKFLLSEGISNLLEEYLNKYNELIDKSMYFRKGVFNHNNASTISKSLKDNGFFAAQHRVTLIDQKAGKKEISNQKELEATIQDEKSRILNDSDLNMRFEAIDKAITKNVELKSFRAYLENNLKILPELTDIEGFGCKLWISYFAANKELYDNSLIVFRTGKKELARIVNIAKRQATIWHEVVTIFNERFSVPFTLEIANQDEVMLKDKSPSLIFRYSDGNARQEMNKDDLLAVLSTGEKRAFYMLNIIFEIQSRQKENYKTILVLDDIADSFDYKNKFAIIEYLKDILETGKFISILLTHNFDFFRTVQSRLSLDRKNCLMALRTDSEIKLTKAEYLNPFPYWKSRMHADNKCLVAIIPMARNLVEYTQGNTSPDYVKLTSLLHRKQDSDSITLKDLEKIIQRVFSMNITLGAGKVIPLIYHQADICFKEPEGINLENKVVLSIAIRLFAETKMINCINNEALTNNIADKQTRRLYDLYKKQFPMDKSGKALLEQVVMMTPEAIHLNSFMYEPLIDISGHHLKMLYNEIKIFAKS